MRLDEPELLDEFLREQPRYSEDFKALALRLCHEHADDLGKVIGLTGVPERTLYQWMADWNAGQQKKAC
jgi:transposase-like protein